MNTEKLLITIDNTKALLIACLKKLLADFGVNLHFMTVSTEYISKELLNDLTLLISILIGKDFYSLQGSISTIEDTINKFDLVKECLSKGILCEDKKNLIFTMHEILPRKAFHNKTFRIIFESVYKTYQMNLIENKSFLFKLITLYCFKRQLVLPHDQFYPLHSAVVEENLYKIRHIILLQSNISIYNDINEVNSCGLTSLALACQQGNMDIVRVLCDHGARPEMKFGNAQSALDIALIIKNPKMLRILFFAYYQQRRDSFELIQKV